MRILFLCAGDNSCRSQMAEAFLRNADRTLDVYSAGFVPALQTDPNAVEVMREAGIDISTQKPKSVRIFEGQTVDYLITIYQNTTDKINLSNISYHHKIHLGFADPRNLPADPKDMLANYRDVRDEIRNELDYFYNRILVPHLSAGQKA